VSALTVGLLIVARVATAVLVADEAGRVGRTHE
jgi:hypothetical protein